MPDQALWAPRLYTHTMLEQPVPPKRAFLSRIGLSRPELRAWALYDWANSAFMTVIVTAVFPIYYSGVAAAGLDEKTATAYYAAASAVALLAVALIAPPLGAVADARGRRKRFLAGFAILGILSTAALFFVEGGDWKLALGKNFQHFSSHCPGCSSHSNIVSLFLNHSSFSPFPQLPCHPLPGSRSLSFLKT